ncbi:MAG: hypothetical protein HRT47_02845 [Candidatus Caenarcaniphilales bacterium]|nr:hypothetical protein [Candidatus Caenarcaniphilales bacterium]
MGQEVKSANFSEEDFILFKDKLRKETSILKNWFENDNFVSEELTCGLELEAWLVDKDYSALAENQNFLSKIQSDLVDSELAKFNIELNTVPRKAKANMLSAFHSDLTNLWQSCTQSAAELEAKLLMIGILPTLRDEQLNMSQVSPMQRYLALNEQVLNLREGKPLLIDIKKKDELNLSHDDVMLEAAATSLQIHLQVPPAKAKRYYNASLIASALTVAAGANSPYLFGNELWEETRIPLFEQAVSVASFRDKKGRNVGRVTFGTDYEHKSLLGLFLENLDGYPILLPDVSNSLPEKLANLRLHNGCIWRWNRPIIGVHSSLDSLPNLRIEHRVISAGPTLSDITANIALYLGLSHYLANLELAPEELLSFEQVRENFYSSAKDGLDAEIKWLDGEIYNIDKLLLGKLLPAAREALLELEIDSEDIDRYFDQILVERVISKRNGSAWQKAFIEKNGQDFKAMTSAYHSMQEEDLPVHKWSL